MQDDASIENAGHLHVLAERAFKEAVAEALEEKARKGEVVAIWQDGKVVDIPAADLIGAVRNS